MVNGGWWIAEQQTSLCASNVLQVLPQLELQRTNSHRGSTTATPGHVLDVDESMS